VEDLGSENGTILGGRTIEQPTALADGSLIVVGATTLRFRMLAAVMSTKTMSR